MSSHTFCFDDYWSELTTNIAKAFVSGSTLGSSKDIRGLTIWSRQMIAIGGVIVSHSSYPHDFISVLINFQGTGLFLGTASDLKNGGPAGLLIGYCIMASLLYSVMVRQLPTSSYLQEELTTIYRLLSVRWYRNFPFQAVNLLWLAGLTHLSLDLLWVFCSGTSEWDCILIYESLG